MFIKLLQVKAIVQSSILPDLKYLAGFLLQRFSVWGFTNSGNNVTQLAKCL